jgi:hypothetical protein
MICCHPPLRHRRRNPHPDDLVLIRPIRAIGAPTLAIERGSCGRSQPLPPARIRARSSAICIRRFTNQRTDVPNNCSIPHLIARERERERGRPSAIASTAVYTALAPNRFRDLWRERIEPPRPTFLAFCRGPPSPPRHGPQAPKLLSRDRDLKRIGSTLQPLSAPAPGPA